MSVIDTLTTNRTGGGYHLTDLNRVGEAVQYLAGLLAGYGYPVDVSPKTDWTQADFIRASDAAQYLADVQALKAAFYGATALPSTMDGLTVAGANNIERLLREIYTHIQHMIADWIYSGEIYSGEGGI